MSQAADIAERRQEILGLVAELDLVAVRAAHASYLAAIDTPEEADKGRTYQRMTRSLRQSLALHERFDRSAAREAREVAQEARRDAILNPSRRADPPPRREFPADIEAADQRTTELRAAVRRVIWTEGFEKSELESEQEIEAACYRRLEDWLHDERCDDDFVTRPLDEQVVDYCAELELDPANAARWRDLDDPEAEYLQLCLDDHRGYAKPPPWHGSG